MIFNTRHQTASLVETPLRGHHWTLQARPQRERLDTRERSPQRVITALKTHSHGATAGALRHARSPQRVSWSQNTFVRRQSESASRRSARVAGPEALLHGATATALRHSGSPKRFLRAQHAFARRHNKSASRRSGHICTAAHPESLSLRRFCTAPQRQRFDTRDLRKGSPSSKHIRAAPQRKCFTEIRTHLHGGTARVAEPEALSHSHSDSASTRAISARVRRAQNTFARRHSESSSTLGISKEGSPSSTRFCTAPQRECFDTHDPTLVAQHLQMSETLHLPRKSLTLLLQMLRLPRDP